MAKGRRRLFGFGLGVGIVVGLFLGSLVVARIGDEAAETARSLADRLLRRSEGVRFEALLQ